MLLDRLSRQSDPVFVKVGANDGISDDPCGNTFLRRDVWRGLLVEPVPYCLRKLRSIYHADRFQIAPVAVGDVPGEQAFYYVDERAGDSLVGLPASYDQLGSFNRQHIVAHLDGVLEPYIREMVIRVETLDRLLASHGFEQIDFLHIDTEGYDYQVLKGLDLQRIRPRAIYLEHKHLSSSDRTRVESKLTLEGYRVLDCGTDYLATVA